MRDYLGAEELLRWKGPVPLFIADSNPRNSGFMNGLS